MIGAYFGALLQSASDRAEVSAIEIDAALVGGVYTICTPDLLVGFSRIGALSKTDACRPFDGRADGFVLGEGVGAVMLKRFEDAVRDRDRIWAVVRGVGLNNDGRGEGPMTPRLSGQVDALQRAYRDAGLSPDSVGYIEAHGTATLVGDTTEISALKENVRARVAFEKYLALKPDAADASRIKEYLAEIDR